MSRQLWPTCCAACRPVIKPSRPVPAIRVAQSGLPKAFRPRPFHSGIVLSDKDSSSKNAGSSSKVQPGLASKLFRRLLSGKPETEQPSTPGNRTNPEPSMNSQVEHERLHVPLSLDMSSGLKIPFLKKAKQKTTTSSPANTSARMSRLAARRKSKRTSRSQTANQQSHSRTKQTAESFDRKTDSERKGDMPTASIDSAGEEDPSSTKNAISSTKWQKRSVTTQEAKDRFDNLVKEFEMQNGSGLRDFDVDDLDGITVPDAIVEGQCYCIGHRECNILTCTVCRSRHE